MISTKNGNDIVTSRSRIRTHVDEAAEVARDRADRGADEEGEQDAERAHLQVDARAPDDPREDVAAEVVGAERMRAAGRQQRSRSGPARSGRRARSRGRRARAPSQNRQIAAAGARRARAGPRAEDAARRGRRRRSPSLDPRVERHGHDVDQEVREHDAAAPGPGSRPGPPGSRGRRSRRPSAGPCRAPRTRVSTTTVPPISQPTLTPSRLIVGISELRNTWWKKIDVARQALGARGGRRSRRCSPRSGSRAGCGSAPATAPAARVSAGRNRCRRRSRKSSP